MRMIELVTEEKWSGSVTPKKHPPEGLFADGSAAAIVKWLKAEHGDKAGAMSALNFYINRAGKNLSAERRQVFNQAKKSLSD